MMLVLSLAVTVSTAVFTQLLMHSERTNVFERADARLLTAAEMLREILGKDYHDHIVDASSVSENDFLQIVNRNDDLCRRLDLQYLWSVIVLENDIVFTSSTRTDIFDLNSNHARFFEVHSDPGAFTPALNVNPGVPVFSTFVNEWGTGRMVLIPRQDVHGRKYIYGASVQLKDLQAQLNSAFITSILIGVMVFLVIFLLSLAFMNHFMRPVANLTASAKRMASGDLNLPLEISGTKEMQSMAISFDQMRKGLREHITELQETNTKEEYENKILTQISKREPLEQILNQIALFCEQQDTKIKASVLLFNSEKQALFHAAAPSLPDEYNDLMVPGLPIGPLVGSCGSAAYHQKLVVARDISSDPGWLPYEQFIRMAKKHNLNACWSQPFFSSEGKLLGTIANYGNQTGGPNSKNLKVLEWSTRIAGLAVEQDLVEKELVSAKLSAEESNKLKTTFLQNMSHEIRTPLNGIIGFSSLLSKINNKDESKEQIEEYVDIIQKSSKYLLAIVNDILEISRIESSTLHLSYNELTVNDLFSTINNLFSSKIKEKGLIFKIYARDGLNNQKIYVDKDKLYQIITNFMSNAVKFTEKGTIELFVQKEKEGISINVKDTGIGIDPKYHDQVFDRFWQYEAFTKQFYGGTGLGLSISKGLAELCGYDIRIRSEFGKGSLFSLLLPNELINKEIYIDKNKVATDADHLKRRNGLNLLVANDDETSLLHISNIIKELGAGFKWVADGNKAVEALGKEKFDLVIMDLKMPVSDGLEAIKLIKSLHPDIFILVQSALAVFEDDQDALNAGCDLFLKKPFEPEELLQAIKKLIFDAP